MVWRISDPIILGATVPRIGDIVTTAPNLPVGTIVRATDSYFGGGEFLLAKGTGTVAVNTLVFWDKDFVITAVENTALLGKALGACSGAFAGSASWGWLQIGGMTPVIANATVAANTLSGITAAGTSGTLAAGKAILNGMTSSSQTATVVKTGVSTTNGSNVIFSPNGTGGWFVGATMSGTGLSGTITAIAPDDKTVTLSANASATGAVSATATYTGYSILAFNRPHAQGPIT
jgi:hypothetical protein